MIKKTNFTNMTLYIYILANFFTEVAKPESFYLSYAIGFFFTFLVIINSIKRGNSIRVSKVVLLLFLFVTYATASHFFSSDVGFIETNLRRLYGLVVIIIGFSIYIKSYEDIVRIMKYYIFSGIIATIYLMLTYDNSGGFRSYALGSPNNAALRMWIAYIYAAILMISTNKKKYLISIIPFVLITLYLTASAKATIATIIFTGVTIMVYAFKSRRTRIKVGLIIVFLAIVVNYFNVETIIQNNMILNRVNNVITTVIGVDDSFSGVSIREQLVDQGLVYFYEKPILGYGIGNYRQMFDFAGNELLTQPHNNYIILLMGVGIVGFLLYHTIFLNSILNLLKLYFKRKNNLITLYIATLGLYLLLSYYQSFYDDIDQFIFITIANSGYLLATRNSKVDLGGSR